MYDTAAEVGLYALRNTDIESFVRQKSLTTIFHSAFGIFVYADINGFGSYAKVPTASHSSNADETIDSKTLHK